MSTHFDPRDGLVIVPAQLTGPKGSSAANLALDTGATSTVIRTGLLVRVGYDPAAAPGRTRMSTGSGVEYAALVPVNKIEALDQQRAGFTVVAHSLPPSAPVDGVLGLDFLRGQALTLDFRAGEITLA